jgi:hypothetical protein
LQLNYRVSLAGGGFEPCHNSPAKSPVSPERGTESGTVGGDSANNQQLADPDLAKVVMAWPNLPAAIRAGILAMVQAAKGSE